jgi:hypothetical protein
MLARVLCRRIVGCYPRTYTPFARVITAGVTGDAAMARAIESTIESRFESDRRLKIRIEPLPTLGLAGTGIQIQPCVLVEAADHGYIFERFYPLA